MKCSSNFFAPLVGSGLFEVAAVLPAAEVPFSPMAWLASTTGVVIVKKLSLVGEPGVINPKVENKFQFLLKKPLLLKILKTKSD